LPWRVFCSYVPKAKRLPGDSQCHIRNVLNTI
jgi:hypothetical protein